MDREPLREALVVGINRYPFLKQKKLGDLNLKAPVKDAEAITNILETYGKFRVQRLPKGYDEQGRERFTSHGLVKINDLEQAIINLFNPPVKNEVPDVALLFFAGHGYVTTKGDIREGFLVTSDVQIDSNIYGISLTWLKKLLQDSPVKKQIVWLDCCFSGELLNFDQEADPGTQGKQISRCLITGSRSFETSVEQLDGKNGVFTANLLAGLNPENYVDGWVTNYILTESIKKKMSETSQAPMFHNSGDAIILTTNTSNQPIDERWKNVAPYRGLSYFQQQENDAVFFHGRTRLTDELIDRVKSNNFVAVLGASGSGKSSLLRAGLLYQLKRGQKISGSDRWLFLNPFTPTSSPLESLQQAINIEGEKPDNLTNKLIEFIEDVAKKEKNEKQKKVVMIIDQFEEAFTLCQGKEEKEQERQEFFDCFLAALERQGDKFCVVLGMRADFLDRCSEYAGLAHQIKQHQLLVTPLQEEEIKEAIKEPAKLVGMQVEDGLVTKITEDFLRNPGSLPLLQYTLDALWKSATQGESKSQFLTLATYRNLGGIKGTLTKRANEVFESLNQEEKSVAKRIFLELVQPGEQQINSGKITDTRRRVILEKLPNERHSLELLSAVSDKLADQNNRLITKDKSEAGTLLDIIHEDLIRSWETLRNWVEEYQEALPLERKIEADAAQWETDGKKEGLLLRAGQLNKAEEYLTKYGEMYLLDGVAYEFIKASKKASQRKSLFSNIVRAFIIFILSLFVLVLLQQKNSEQKSKMFFAYKLALDSEQLRENSLETSVVLALESMKKVQELKEFQQSYWGKMLDLLNIQFPDIPHKEADQAIRNGLAQLPNHLHTLKHLNIVRKVAFSPDGKTIATGSWDQTVRLWDVATGNVIAILNHDDIISDVAFSPDGKTIATASDDTTVRFWDTATGKLITTLNHQNTIRIVVFSPDGKTIATANGGSASGDGNTAYLWDTATGQLITTLNHKNTLTKLAFSPDGKTIATASGDGTAKLWNLSTGNAIATLKHQKWLTEVSFSPNGKTIATKTSNLRGNGTSYLWDAATGNAIATFIHQDVNAVTFSPDGKTIATGSDDGTVRLWDAVTGNAIATFNHQTSVTVVTFSPDGKTIATASDKGIAHLWDVATGNAMATFSHEKSVTAVIFSPDGQTIATASDDNTAKLWNASTAQPIAILKHDDIVWEVSFSPDVPTIIPTIATASDDNTVKLWSTTTGKAIATLNHQELVTAVANSPGIDYQKWITAIAFSSDGQTIATASGDGTARLWNTAGMNVRYTLKHQEIINAIAFSRDSEIIATASSDGTAKLWDVATGNMIFTLNHQEIVRTVAFSSDKKIIATAGADGTAKLWSVSTGNIIFTLNHQEIVRTVAFSSDNKIIATAGADGTAKLWDVATGNVITTLKHETINDAVRLSNAKGNDIVIIEYPKWITAVAFSVDSKIIVTASGDGTAKLWDAKGNALLTLNHKRIVWEIAFSPDGKTIATASGDGTAKLWDVATGKELATFNHKNTVRSLSFSSDGQIIATASDDKTAHLYWATPEALIQQACQRLSRNLTADEWQQYMNSDLETYQKTCDQLPVHNSVIKTATDKAKKEKIKDAISIFKQAQKLDPKIDLDPYTETIETEPEGVAKKFAASSKIEKAKKEAIAENIDEAISLYQAAQKLSPTIDLEPNTETIETEPESLAKSWAADSKVKEGKELATRGKIKEAISIFKQAQKLDPEIDLDSKTKTREIDPEIVAKKFAASGKIEEGQRLAHKGKIKQAISLYDEAQQLNSDLEIDARDWDSICWFGSLYNQAQDVMFACEKAVKLSPDDDLILSGRGLARALTGDYQGAIEDFQVFVDSMKDGKEKAKYKGWIETLKKGENPITSEVLEELKI